MPRRTLIAKKVNNALICIFKPPLYTKNASLIEMRFI